MSVRERARGNLARLERVARRILRPVRRGLRGAIVRSYATGRFHPKILRGTPSASALPVIVCLWNRPERIDAILDELAAQTGVSQVRLLLWNNARRQSRHYRNAIARHPLGDAIGSVEFVDSVMNVGGLARFLLFRRLRRSGYRGPVIMLDDDQVIGSTFFAELVRRYRARSYVGVWAFRQVTGYWDREELADGEAATYVGTGGSICDSSIVDESDFFSALPARYLFIEDLWLSHRARAAGWRLEKADLGFTFVLSEADQFHGLGELKEEFYRYLR